MKIIIVPLVFILAITSIGCVDKKNSIKKSEVKYSQDYKCKRGVKWVIFSLETNNNKYLTPEQEKQELKAHCNNLLMNYNSCKKIDPDS